MVQEKKKNMDDTSDKKGRTQGRDEDEKSSQKSTGSTGKTSSGTNKNDSSRKSR